MFILIGMHMQIRLGHFRLGHFRLDLLGTNIPHWSLHMRTLSSGACEHSLWLQALKNTLTALCVAKGKIDKAVAPWCFRGLILDIWSGAKHGRILSHVFSSSFHVCHLSRKTQAHFFGSCLDGALKCNWILWKHVLTKPRVSISDWHRLVHLLYASWEDREKDKKLRIDCTTLSKLRWWR